MTSWDYLAVADDGNLRPLFRQRLREGFHWVSVETGGTGRGIPDSEYCARRPDGTSVSGWIEYKQTTGWNVTLRPEQVAWHRVRWERGGRSLVAVRRWPEAGVRRAAADELWIFEGRWAPDLREGGLRSGIPALYIGEGGPSQWDWDLIRCVLLGREP